MLQSALIYAKLLLMGKLNNLRHPIRMTAADRVAEFKHQMTTYC